MPITALTTGKMSEPRNNVSRTAHLFRRVTQEVLQQSKPVIRLHKAPIPACSGSGFELSAETKLIKVNQQRTLTGFDWAIQAHGLASKIRCLTVLPAGAPRADRLRGFLTVRIFSASEKDMNLTIPWVLLSTWATVNIT